MTFLPDPDPDYYEARFEAKGPSRNWRRRHQPKDPTRLPTELANTVLENERLRVKRKRRATEDREKLGS
jgi:hypothetical protein